MIKPIAFIFNPSIEEEKLARKWLSLTELDIDLFALPSYDPKYLIKPYNYIITFGSIAKTTIENFLNTSKINNTKLFALPNLKLLSKKDENLENRQLAINILNELAEDIRNEELLALPDVNITEEDLPDLQSKQLILLSKIMEESQKNSCIYLSKSGKMVEVTINPYQLPNPNADFSITVAELYTVKAVMEVLDVKKATLVYEVNNTTNSDSNNLSDNKTNFNFNFEKDKS